MHKLLLAIVIAALALPGMSPAQEGAKAEKPSLKLADPLKESASPGESTLADQTDVAITAYNTNRALVRDRRTIKLLPGEMTLKFMDVAAQIMPETVSLKSVSNPGGLQILEQNYEYDLMTQASLLNKYVGKNVRLINKSNDLSFIEETATLLSNNDGPIYQINDDIYLGHPGSVVLPEIPEELIAKPSLIWLLNNGGTDHEVEVTYLTNGVSWKADYVATLSKDEKTIDLEGWVTLTNESGAQYTNAQLKLVAGDVNVVQNAPMPMMAKGAAMEMMAFDAAAAPMQQEAFGEYHLYTLPRRTTIKQNQSKQVSLLRADGATVTKVYEFRGPGHYYSQPTESTPEHIGVTLKLKNEEANKLGMPLPAGIMRVYQEDSSGMLQFTGEDNVKHTPKDEEITLRLGNAFDVMGERTQTEFNVVGVNVHQSSYKIVLRNHKDTAVTVDVVETIPGDWKILEASHPHVKKDAQTAVFTIPVPVDGEVELTYQAQVRF
jgi:hypothetical protein